MRQNFIFQSAAYLIEGKSNFLSSLLFGGFLYKVVNYIQENTPKEILGCSIILWLSVFAVNLWDIHTGIRADTKLQKEKNETFKFNPDKGWRAFEKIIGFSIIIAVLYSFEAEALRLKYDDIWSKILNYSKFVFFFYVVLIELKSIGNNNKIRFGEKSDLFIMLDNIISIVNEGIISNLKKFLRIKTQENE